MGQTDHQDHHTRSLISSANVLKVAAIQLSAGCNVGTNLVIAAQWINRAAQKGVDLIVLPECFALIGRTEKDYQVIKESLGEGRIQNFLSEQAKLHRLWIVGGSIAVKSTEDEKIHNTVTVWNPDGELIAHYHKMHLFDVDIVGMRRYQESSYVLKGNEVVTVDIGITRLGLSVCYDLRFPELYRELRRQEAEIFVIPAVFASMTGRMHWHPLLKARAIENQCFVVASNQWGALANNIQAYGHSLIVDPWGEVLAESHRGVGFVIHSLNLERLRFLREEFPVWSHRQLISQGQ